MTQLVDVLDPTLLRDMLEKKYVREQSHPLFPELRILNYTETATWENVWNEVTLQCRGLIYNADTFEVLARPFRKFFNHEQVQAPTFSLLDRMHVTDKADGSLGILYRRPDKMWAIATRGSFASDQALWATKHYLENYSHKWEPDGIATWLFEIVYPDNRIVLDYGDMEDLILLGAVDIDSGLSLRPETAAQYWPGPAVELIHTDLPFGDILAMPPRENREGFVLWHVDSDERVKIKYEDYKVLHKFLTNTSEKHVWEALSQGLDMEATFAGAPDEFHEWLRNVIDEFHKQFNDMWVAANFYYSGVQLDVSESVESPEYTRKEFAEAAQRVPQPYRSMVFLIEDHKSIDDLIWKQIKPSGSTTFKKIDSDSD